MGVLVIGLNFITNVWVAAPFLILLGALGGYLVVPMNALLQHRGHNLMGAGRSIAVQNFNEQACILGLGAFYAGMTKFGLSAFGAITIFGLVVAGIDVADPPLAPRATACCTATRSSACWPSRAPTSIDGAHRARLACRRCWRCVFNAFTWGVSWWPFRQLRGARPAPAVGHRADLPAGGAGHHRCGGRRAWRQLLRARRRCGCWCWPRAPPTPPSTGA